jgi:hypothetical protein
MKSKLVCLILPLFALHLVPLDAQPRPGLQACDAQAVPLNLAPLGNKARNDIVAAITRTLRDSAPDRGVARAIALESWASYPKLSATDRTIVVTAGPDNPNNGVSNRQIWVFRLVGRHAELLVEDWTLMCDFDPASYHNGLADLRLRYNVSGGRNSVTTFQFDGKHYQAIR